MTASKIHAGTYRNLSFHLWPQKKSENSTQERVFFREEGSRFVMVKEQNRWSIYISVLKIRKLRSRELESRHVLCSGLCCD